MTTALVVRALDVIVTSDCNLRCGYCYQNAKRAGRLRWAVLEPALDRVLRSAAPKPRVTFVGGEPLLGFPLVQRAVRYVERHVAADRPVRFGISTNGTLLGDAEADFLAHHRFFVQLSFDGVPPAQEARGRGTFARLDAVLDRLRRRQPDLFVRRLSVAITLTRQNLPHLAESIAYLLGHRVFDIAIAPALGAGGAWERRDVDRLDDQIGQVARICGDHRAATGLQPVRNLRPARRRRSGAGLPDAFCGVARGEVLALDVDGQVYGCLLFARSYQRLPDTELGRAVERLGLGPVASRALGRRVAGHREQIAALRAFNHRSAKRSAYAACARCFCRRECFVCPMSIVLEPGNADPDRIPDLACAFNRVVARHRRRLDGAGAEARHTGIAPPMPRLVRAFLDRHQGREVAFPREEASNEGPTGRRPQGPTGR